MGNVCFGPPEPPPNPLAVDLTHFELLKVVGKGGFGKVNAIQRKSDQTLKALKRMSKCEVVKKESHIRMVWVERNIMAKLNSPFLVGLEHAFQNDRELFFVMPFMQGGDLRYHLSKRGVMTEDECRFYAAEMILGLEAMHKLRIVYRDFKPDNLLLDADGHLRISDFGLSVQLEEKYHYKMKGNAGCLEENSFILSADHQWIRVGDLPSTEDARPGDWPLLLDQDGKPQSIGKVYRGIADEMYRIESGLFNTDPYYVTRDHELCFIWTHEPFGCFHPLQCSYSIVYFDRELTPHLILHSFRHPSHSHSSHTSTSSSCADESELADSASEAASRAWAEFAALDSSRVLRYGDRFKVRAWRAWRAFQASEIVKAALRPHRVATCKQEERGQEKGCERVHVAGSVDGGEEEFPGRIRIERVNERMSWVGITVNDERHNVVLKDGTVTGNTSGYLAPEVCAGEYYGTAPDVWSFGITIYELLHGCRPYRQWRPDKDYISRMQFGSHLTPEARSFIRALLTVDPRKRLGCGPLGWEEVKRHSWFRLFNWSDVLHKRIKPPIQPDLEHANCSNQADLADQLIDKKPEPIPPELQKHFIGFDFNTEITKKNNHHDEEEEEKKLRRIEDEVEEEKKTEVISESDMMTTGLSDDNAAQIQLHSQAKRASIDQRSPQQMTSAASSVASPAVPDPSSPPFHSAHQQRKPHLRSSSSLPHHVASSLAASSSSSSSSSSTVPPTLPVHYAHTTATLPVTASIMAGTQTAQTTARGSITSANDPPGTPAHAIEALNLQASRKSSTVLPTPLHVNPSSSLPSPLLSSSPPVPANSSSSAAAGDGQAFHDLSKHMSASLGSGGNNMMATAAAMWEDSKRDRKDERRHERRISRERNGPMSSPSNRIAPAPATASSSSSASIPAAAPSSSPSPAVPPDRSDGGGKGMLYEVKEVPESHLVSNSSSDHSSGSGVSVASDNDIPAPKEEEKLPPSEAPADSNATPRGKVTVILKSKSLSNIKKSPRIMMS